MVNVTSPRILLLVLAVAWAVGACGDDDDDDDDTADGDADADADSDGDSDGDGDADGDGDGDGDADADADADGDADGDVECTPGVTQCTNCIDDDEDGRTDGFDPSCTGAMDDDEFTFSTGIPGDNRDYTWQDCFFDGDSGGGNDCRYHVCCILSDCPPEDAAGFNPETDCPITDECIDHCAPLTAPGCDCFGCCTICDGDLCRDVITNPTIAPDCTVELLGDPVACPACEMAEDCGSSCDPEQCILCPGQVQEDLPDECFDVEGADPNAPVNQCPDDLTACVTSQDCEPGFYCSVGCCILDGPF